MNKNTMMLQGFIIVFLLGVILVIGYSKQDREYISYTRELRTACIKYMKDNNTKLKFNETTIIFIDDLLKDEYITTTNDKYCIYSVSYTKGLILGKYKANKDCYIYKKDIKVEEKNTIEENETEKE